MRLVVLCCGEGLMRHIMAASFVLLVAACVFCLAVLSPAQTTQGAGSLIKPLPNWVWVSQSGGNCVYIYPGYNVFVVPVGPGGC